MTSLGFLESCFRADGSETSGGRYTHRKLSVEKAELVIGWESADYTFEAACIICIISIL